jgi:aldehyde dehydrogenase (NAD+)
MSNTVSATKFYIDGAWVAPTTSEVKDVINPATEEVIAQVALGGEADVNLAILAAKRAFPQWSKTSPGERLKVMEAVVEVYARRANELAATVTSEMGSPADFAARQHVQAGLTHLKTAMDVLRHYQFEQPHGKHVILREPIGVCALITPWNWPLNQITAKVTPALAAGCTMVLKPSDLAPLNATLFAEVLDEAGVPKGVFNMVHGNGDGVGTILSCHPDVDMVSFTGSNRAGVKV